MFLVVQTIQKGRRSKRKWGEEVGSDLKKSGAKVQIECKWRLGEKCWDERNLHTQAYEFASCKKITSSFLRMMNKERVYNLGRIRLWNRCINTFHNSLFGCCTPECNQVHEIYIDCVQQSVRMITHISYRNLHKTWCENWQNIWCILRLSGQKSYTVFVRFLSPTPPPIFFFFHSLIYFTVYSIFSLICLRQHIWLSAFSFCP